MIYCLFVHSGGYEVRIKRANSVHTTEPQVTYKLHCHYQNVSPLANRVYLITIVNKTPLRNGNCPVTNLITEMGVAHTVGLSVLSELGAWCEHGELRHHLETH